METKRQEFLDIAKGIGIIFVLFSHSCGFPIFGKAVVDFYMPLFFFVSGYVYRPGRSVGDNIKRKMKQLLIPYVGFTAIMYCEHMAIAWIKKEITKKTLLMPIVGALYSRAALYLEMNEDNIYFLIIDNGVMWFITAMAMASIFYYLLVEKFLSGNKQRWIIGGALIGLTMAMSYLPILLPWSLDVVPSCTLFMLLGAWLGRNNYYAEKRCSIVFLGIAVLFYCLITEYANPINISIRDYGYPGVVGVMWYVVVSLIGTMLFLWICKYIEKVSWLQWISFIGKHTLSIMALHILMFKYLTKCYYLLHMSFPFDRSCWLYWVYWMAVFTVVIMVCIVFDIMLDMVKSKIHFRRK